MRKLLLSAMVAAGMFCTAQAQQGSVLVMGNIGFTHNNRPSVTTNSFNFNPGVGYQVNEHWTFGGELSIGSTKEKPELGNTQKYSTFSAGPFARYTHNISDVFSVFGQAGLGYQQSKAGSNQSNGMYVKLFPAIFINVKDGFGLNFDFGGLNYGNLNPKEGDGTSEFGFNFGKNLNIGISKNF